MNISRLLGDRSRLLLVTRISSIAYLGRELARGTCAIKSMRNPVTKLPFVEYIFHTLDPIFCRILFDDSKVMQEIRKAVMPLNPEAVRIIFRFITKGNEASSIIKDCTQPWCIWSTRSSCETLSCLLHTVEDEVAEANRCGMDGFALLRMRMGNESDELACAPSRKIWDRTVDIMLQEHGDNKYDYGMTFVNLVRTRLPRNSDGYSRV